MSEPTYLHPAPSGKVRAAIEAMRDLPYQMAPPVSWKQFERYSLKRVRRERQVAVWRNVALAAGICVLALGAAWHLLDAPRSTVKQAADFDTPSKVVPGGDRSEPIVVSVGTRLAAADLEDQIARIDALLERQRNGQLSSEHMADLFRKRDSLVDSLVKIRYAESLLAALPCTEGWETL